MSTNSSPTKSRAPLIERLSHVAEKKFVDQFLQDKGKLITIAADFMVNQLREHLEAQGHPCKADWSKTNQHLQKTQIEPATRGNNLLEELVSQAFYYSCAWFQGDLEGHLDQLSDLDLTVRLQTWLNEPRADETRLSILFNLCAQNLARVLTNALVTAAETNLSQLESLLKLEDVLPPRPPASPIQGYLEIINAAHYHDVRDALSRNRFNQSDDSPYPIAILDKGSSKGYAELRPAANDMRPFIPPEEEKYWIEEMWKQREELSDLDADVMDSLSCVWLRHARGPEHDATASIANLLEMRGIQQKKGGLGRRGGYRRKQRMEMLQALGHIQNLWLNMAEMEVYDEGRGRRPKKMAVKSRAFAITDMMGQLNLNGSLDVSHFVFRPGKVFANFLFGSGRQTALLSALALTYDPYRQKAEKRLTRYLSWQWRCQAGKGCNSKTYRVATLLEGIGNEINARFPHRTREGLEAALDTLQVDQIIASWEYERWDEETATKKGWLQHWQEATIVIKPPVEIVERYLTVDHRESLPPPSQTLIERLRLRRESLGLSQAQVAKQMGLNQSTLNRLERGIQTASREVRPKIQNWLQATESASE